MVSSLTRATCHILCIPFFHMVIKLIFSSFLLRSLINIIFIGGKGVKALSKIVKGALKNEGKMWFYELSDKGYF